jgi:hypothetical protein
VSRNGDGRVRRAYLLAGTQLRCGEVELTLPAATTCLKVDSVEGRTFHLTDDLPPALVTPGRYVLADRTGYETESTGERTITVRDYPAIECDAITLLHEAVHSPDIAAK